MLPNDIAIGSAALFIGSVPLHERDDLEICANHLSGPLAEATFTAALAAGIDDATRDLDEAHQNMLTAKDDNDGLTHIIADRRALPTEMVPVGPLMMTRQQNRDELPILQANADNRAFSGDHDHEKCASNGISGWLIAAGVSIIEGGFSARIFNVDLGHLTLNVLTWATIVVLLTLFNHHLIKIGGRRQREYRETRKQNQIVAQMAFATIHGQTLSVPVTPRPTGSQPGPRPPTGPEIAGLEAGTEEVKYRRRLRSVAMAVLWTPLVALFLAMYLRFHEFTQRVLGGLFGYVFPIVIVLVLAALTWWALQIASQGNGLGDRQFAAQAVEMQTQQLDAMHDHDALALAAHRQTALKLGRERVDDADHKAHLFCTYVEIGRRAAAQVLGVRELRPIKIANIELPEWARRARVLDGLESERMRGATLDPLAQTSAMYLVARHRTPWEIFRNAPAKIPNLAAAGEHSMPVMNRPWLHSPAAFPAGQHRPRLTLCLAVIAILVVTITAVILLI
jgi:hypothetical protein